MTKPNELATELYEMSLTEFQKQYLKDILKR